MSRRALFGNYFGSTGGGNGSGYKYFIGKYMNFLKIKNKTNFLMLENFIALNVYIRKTKILNNQW